MVLEAGLVTIRLNFSKLPLQGWFLLLTKTFFDSELAISENSVRPANILHNSSLIMGRQIINILPEGYVLTKPYTLQLAIAC